MAKFFFTIFKSLSLIVLPFVALIRGAVFFHVNYETHAWLSIVGGILMSAFILSIYFIFIQARLKGNSGNIRKKYRTALILVLVYCLPSVLYISAANAKHAEVKNEFTDLHPVLRLGISTVIFLDNDLLLTDAKRIPEDYKKMGLKTKAHSLHYKQSDGYAHAVDIRVNGRSWLRNGLLKLYFAAMGFNTLRHHGTADHLHVSLLSHDRPGGI